MKEWVTAGASRQGAIPAARAARVAEDQRHCVTEIVAAVVEAEARLWDRHLLAELTEELVRREHHNIHSWVHEMEIRGELLARPQRDLERRGKIVHMSDQWPMVRVDV